MMGKVSLTAACALCGLVAFFAVLVRPTARAAIKTQTVDYKIGNDTFEGYLAYDDAAKGKRPGVVIYPAWTGISDNEREHAERLAKAGYVAFVADIYGKGLHPKPPQESGAMAGKFMANRPLLRARANAGLDMLKKNPMVDTSKLLAMGYCFGGGSVLELIRSGAPILGTVTFHGSLGTPTPEDAKNIKAHLLVLQGQDDPNTPPDKTADFEKNMEAAHVDLQYVSYSGTAHCYTDVSAGNDNSKGAAYNAESDRRSWIAMQDFFKETLAR